MGNLGKNNTENEITGARGTGHSRGICETQNFQTLMHSIKKVGILIHGRETQSGDGGGEEKLEGVAGGVLVSGVRKKKSG